MSNEEKRKSARIDSRVSIIYSVPYQGIRHRVDSAALTMNISAGGIQFRAFHPMELQTELKVKILQNKHISSRNAIVVRCEPVAGARAWVIAAEFTS